MCGIDLNDGSFRKKKHCYFYTKDNKSDTVSTKNLKSKKVKWKNTYRSEVPINGLQQHTCVYIFFLIRWNIKVPFLPWLSNDHQENIPTKIIKDTAAALKIKGEFQESFTGEPFVNEKLPGMPISLFCKLLKRKIKLRPIMKCIF